MSPQPPYSYAVPNAELIQEHQLEPHFEGGFFKQTIALGSKPATAETSGRSSVSTVSGPRVQHASGSGTALLHEATVGADASHNDATCIYYLITPESSRGRMHMNDHAASFAPLAECALTNALTEQTFHIHHAGRALYTLIAPGARVGEAPIVHRIVMGSNLAAGEVTQLFVPGGWWKASEIPDEDLLLLDAPGAGDLRERVGCLISEVVVPGWTLDQHQFLTTDKVRRR